MRMKIARFTGRGLFLFLVLFCTGAAVTGQSREVKTKIRKAEQAKKNNNKKYNNARDKELKHRYDIQTPKTQDRIDNSHKQAAKFNDKGKKRKAKKPKN